MLTLGFCVKKNPFDYFTYLTCLYFEEIIWFYWGGWLLCPALTLVYFPLLSLFPLPLFPQNTVRGISRLCVFLSRVIFEFDKKWAVNLQSRWDYSH